MVPVEKLLCFCEMVAIRSSLWEYSWLWGIAEHFSRMWETLTRCPVERGCETSFWMEHRDISDISVSDATVHAIAQLVHFGWADELSWGICYLEIHLEENNNLLTYGTAANLHCHRVCGSAAGCARSDQSTQSAAQEALGTWSAHTTP